MRDEEGFPIIRGTLGEQFLQGCDGRLRILGTGCHGRFLSVAVSDSFAPTDCTEEAIAVALCEVEPLTTCDQAC